MPTYVEILDSEIAAENPVTVSLMTRLRDNALAYPGAPTGTRSPFQQTSAPLGWTKETSSTYNEAAPRVVTGSVATGGSVNFSTVFARTATDGHALTPAEGPVHGHGVSDPTHIHSGSTAGSSANVVAGTGPLALIAPQSMGNAPTGISIQNAGSGSAHTHNIDLRVKYVDQIIATKD